MVRRSPFFVLLLPLLAACGSSAPVPPSRTEATAFEPARYLEGVGTRYSVRLDEVTRSEKPEEALPAALVAGDSTMTIVASLFRVGDVYTVDMVVHNLTDTELFIDRNEIELFDNRGDKLLPMFDWEMGPMYGLRSQQATYRGYHHLGADFQAGQSGIKGENPRNSTGTKPVPQSQVGGLAPSASNPLPSTDTDFSWISELRMERATVMLPAKIQVAPMSSSPYWGYWRGSSLEYPITAIIVVGVKRMLFRFDEEGNVVREARWE